MAIRIITRRRLREFGDKFIDARGPLADWAAKAAGAEWHGLNDVRRTFRDADEVKVGSGKPVTVFNVKGGRYRLIVAIHYDRQRLYVMRFMTHAEYDKDAWKRQL